MNVEYPMLTRILLMWTGYGVVIEDITPSLTEALLRLSLGTEKELKFTICVSVPEASTFTCLDGDGEEIEMSGNNLAKLFKSSFSECLGETKEFITLKSRIRTGEFWCEELRETIVSGAINNMIGRKDKEEETEDDK